MTKNKIDILVLGGGGREHALAWKIAQSPECGALYCAPGNGGTEGVAENVALDPCDPAAVVAFCRDKNIGLAVIGPEAPLVAGVSDALAAADIPAFGASAAAAQLEASKRFTKSLCAEAGIPTAAAGDFDTAEAAHEYVRDHSLPVVVKADGLAAGKGVVIAETHEAAHEAIDRMFDGAFGAAGAAVVIEEFMTGVEASFFVLCDGTHALPLATAQDYKRVGEGDTGLNTGGMGAISPAPAMTQERIAETMAHIIAPTLDTMRARGTPYRGVLYAGLMVGEAGVKLVEYNCRFGDPECQVLMPRLKSDIVPALHAAATGTLDGLTLDWDDAAAITIVMAAQGYPEKYESGTEIRNLGAEGEHVIFHAGTSRADGTLRATGGRVLNMTASGKTLAEARAKAYAGLQAIDWPQGFYRRDIGRGIGDDAG